MTKPLLKLPKGWNRHKRFDRRITENVCLHGIGHPDPTTLKKGDRGLHGCDGCCMVIEAYQNPEPVVAWALVSPEGNIVGLWRDRNNATLNGCPTDLGWKVVKLVEESDE